MPPENIPSKDSSQPQPNTNHAVIQPEQDPNPHRPTSMIGHLTPEQQAEIITRCFEGAPATGTIALSYKPPTYDPKYDLPENSFDNTLVRYHRQAQESYVMEAGISAENEAREISWEPPCQKVPEGYEPPTYDPRYDLPEYSFEALLAKLQRQTEEARVMEAEIAAEQRARLAKARKYQEERAAAAQGDHPVQRGGGMDQRGGQQQVAAYFAQQQPPLPRQQQQQPLPTPPTDTQNQREPNESS